MSKFSESNIKFLAIIAYLGPLFVVGKCAVEKESAELKFHCKQGEILFYSMTILTGFILIFNTVANVFLESLEIISLLLYTGVAVAWVILIMMGVTNALRGASAYLPLVGDIVKIVTKDEG